MAGFHDFIPPLLHDLASTIGFCGFPILLFYVSKILWHFYVLSTANDRTSILTKKLPLPPGSFGIPFLGETLSWAAQGSSFNSSRREKHGTVFSTHFLGRAMVKVTGADNVRQILQGEHEKVTTTWPTTIRKIVGDHSIANCSGEEHRYMRKLAIKGFSHSALNSYIPHVRRAVSKQIKEWTTSSKPQNIYQDILHMTFEASAKAMVGLTFEKASEMKKAFHTFSEMVNNLFSLPYDMPFLGFRKGYRCSREIHRILHDHLTKKMQRLRCNGNNNGEESREDESDVIQHILEGDVAERRKRRSNDSESDSERSGDESGKCGFTLERLKENCVELMFAGFLTTGSSISSFMIQLAKHPKVRQKLEEEIEEHGLLNFEDDENIDLERLQKLTYLELVIKETLRVSPPVLGGYRRALKTFQIGNYRIPKGWTIIYNIRDTHEYEFGDHSDFDPERFSRKNWSEDRNSRFKWLPFGGGPRTCVGKDFGKLIIKLTAIELFRAFKSWDFAGGKEPPMFPIPTLHPTNGLPLLFISRKP